MFRSYSIEVCPGHALFDYFEKCSVAYTNMYNSGLFVCRQVYFGLNKEEDKRHDNEKEVLQQIKDALPMMQATRKDGQPYPMPEKGKSSLSYPFLNSFFYVTENKDYFTEVLPRQSVQQALRQICQDMKAFYASKRAYKEDPSGFLGEPKAPKYKPKGQGSTFIMTNQTCHVKRKSDGECELQLPYFNKVKQVLSLGKYVQSDWILRQVNVVPHHGIFDVIMVFDDGKPIPELRTEKTGSQKICAIDLGVTNFAAMSNNIGKPAMLIKGGAVINANHHCTKYVGRLQSLQTKGTTTKLTPTKRVKRLIINRENRLSDFIHKSAKLIINWCTDNDIDTLVIGSNTHWKQNVNIGKNTQIFEQIPYDQFKKTLKYLCEREGILYYEQEESYTSKASFLDNDPIPVHQSEDAEKVIFSGTRSGRLYKTKSGLTVNADINGSANIGRKAFPVCFNSETCDILSIPTIFRHPDQGLSAII